MTNKHQETDPATPLRRFWLSLAVASRLQGLSFANEVYVADARSMPDGGITPEILIAYIESKKQQTGLEMIAILGVVELTPSTHGEVEEQNKRAKMAMLLHGKGTNGTVS